MARKALVSLWFQSGAEDAARFYAATFPDTTVDAVHYAPADSPSGKTRYTTAPPNRRREVAKQKIASSWRAPRGSPDPYQAMTPPATSRFGRA